MPRHTARIVCPGILILCIGLCGCSSYKAPGRGANLSLIASKDAENPLPSSGLEQPADPPTAAGRDVQIDRRDATASFPAHVVVVRIQEPGYKSMTSEGIGGGRYSVVTVRDIERDEDFERLGRLTALAEISPLSRLLLPSSFESDRELRQAAARVQADLLLLYTVDTTFLDTNKSTPLSILTLGFGRTIDVRVLTTVSALLLDTQTGYVYGTIEETAREQTTSAAVDTKDACDAMRLRTERKAFEAFLAEFEALWPRIVETYEK